MITKGINNALAIAYYSRQLGIAHIIILRHIIYHWHAKGATVVDLGLGFLQFNMARGHRVSNTVNDNKLQGASSDENNIKAY